MATVFPVSEPSRDLGTEPDLIACLCDAAFLTSVVSSDGLRSAMESRWRGAKGDTDGVAELENNRRPVRQRNARCASPFIFNSTPVNCGEQLLRGFFQDRAQ